MKKFLVHSVLFCLLLAVGALLSARELPLNTLSQEEKEQGFALLFDGKVLDCSVWEGAVDAYCIEKGCLIARPGGFLVTKSDYSDFVLRFEFKLPPAGNNGIGIRCKPVGSPGRTGMEIQILDDTADEYKNLNPTQYNGAIYGVAAPIQGHLKPLGEWNTEEIIANGSHIKITLNNMVIVDVNLDDIKEFPIKGLVPGVKNKTGRLGLAGHNSPVEFCNLRIKKIVPQNKSK